MAARALRLTGARLAYGDHAVLDGLDLDVPRGETLVVLGASGSGKSTLLRVLAGLEPLADGHLEQPDGPVHVATVFQQPLLLPWLDVRANVALGGRYRANRDRFDDAHVDELLALFGLDALAAAPVATLSGGQAQRVAVARAVAVRPDVLLADEPFSALDPATRRSLQSWLRDTARTLGLTVVLVTHDVDEALFLGRTVTVLDGSGRTAGSWEVAPVTDHDELAGHPLRPALLARYESQAGLAAEGRT